MIVRAIILAIPLVMCGIVAIVKRDKLEVIDWWTLCVIALMLSMLVCVQVFNIIRSYTLYITSFVY